MNYPTDSYTETGAQDTFPQEDFKDEKVDPLCKYVADCVSEQKDGGLIHNHGHIDAWYLFKKVLTFAKEERHPVTKERYPVTIVCGTMREDFYNHLTDQLQALIDKRVPVRAYLTSRAPADMDLDKNEFARMLSAAAVRHPESYELVGADMPDKAKIPHAIYAGENGEAFRLEKDLKKRTAIGSFGPLDPSLGGPVGEIMATRMKKHIERIKQRTAQ